MDFKSLISKISEMDDKIETVAAPELPKTVKLTEDAELRVLAGTSTLLKELDMNLLKAAQKGQEGKPIGKPDPESDKNVKKKYGYRMDGEPAERDDDPTKQERRGRKRKNEDVEINADEFKSKFNKMVEAKKDKMSKKDKKMDEAAKPDFLDMDKDGDKKEPMKKAVADKKKGAVGKKDEKTDEGIISTPAKMVGKAIGGVTKAVGAVAGIPGGIKKAFGKGKQKSQDVISGDDEDSKRKESVGESKKSSSNKEESKTEKKGGKKGMSDKQAKYFGKKKTVKESYEPKLTFKDMVRLVQESGGQQQIDPVDSALFNWAQRVAVAKLGEGMKADLYAGLIYERNGGRFEMYDVLSEDQK